MMGVPVVAYREMGKGVAESVNPWSAYPRYTTSSRFREMHPQR